MRLTNLVAAMAAAFTVPVLAQGPATKALPLDNLGLEHLDIVVPDPAASAAFYSRVFKSALHQQPMRDSLRYFVLLGDLPADRQVGYIAIGAAGGRAPANGHYCVLAKVYDRAGKPCPGCRCDASRTGGIRKIVQCGRSTYYCGHRQR